MSESIIEIQDLVRSFDDVKAVDGISFKISKGQVVGFIGANGAGKTTTMRIMASLDLPDEGTVRIGGYDVVEDPAKVRRLIGWMPDHYGQYDNVTVYDYLDFYARAYGYRGEERYRRLKDVMAFTDLAPISERPMKGLSKGMGQRLCLGRTLLHDPEVLVLDEPAAGLDPKARLEFKNLVRILSGRGKTLFISSHILSELGEMCDTMLFIDEGRLVHHGSAEELKRSSDTETEMEIQVVGEMERLLEWLQLNEGWTIVRRQRSGVQATFHSQSVEEVSDQLRRMINDGVRVLEFRRIDRKLEDVFVDLLDKAGKEERPQS